MTGGCCCCHIFSRVSVCSTELKLCRNTILRNAGTNGCDDAGSRKPPLGRRDTSTLPPAPPAGGVVRRSQVCLSTFYKECAEAADSEPDCGCQPAERDGRSVRCEESDDVMMTFCHPQ